MVASKYFDVHLIFKMKTIIIKDSFYNSSIVQGLRMMYTKSIVFVRSTEIIADLVFPFCVNMSFIIFYPDSLNKDGILRLNAISQVYDTIVAIACISSEEASLYEHFLCSIPPKITAVVCFPYLNFQKTVSSFIYETIDKYKSKTRELEKSIDYKRKHCFIRELNIFRSTDSKQKELITLMKKDKNSIQKAVKRELSVLLGCNNQVNDNIGCISNNDKM